MGPMNKSEFSGNLSDVEWANASFLLTTSLVTVANGKVTSGVVNVSTSWRQSDVSYDDATWILTSAFIIFTMQSGRCTCIYSTGHY